MPTFRIRHTTRYTYKEPVRDSANQIILVPIEDEFQHLVKQELVITGDRDVDIFQDYYGNSVGSFTYAQPHVELSIQSKTEVTVQPKEMPDDTAAATDQWEQVDNIKLTHPYIDFIKYQSFEGETEVTQLPEILTGRSLTPLSAAKKMSEFIYNNFQYNSGVTDVETTIGEIWKLKAGVCQDFAHL